MALNSVDATMSVARAGKAAVSRHIATAMIEILRASKFIIIP
jgi:hypothetical protein